VQTYYIDCLVKELGINNNRRNPIYTPTLLSKDEIISNNKSLIVEAPDHCTFHSQRWTPDLL